MNQIITAKSYSEEKEVHFFNLIQPTLWSKKNENLTEIEKLIIKNEQLTKNNPKKYYDLGYPLLKNIIKQNDLKLYSFDFTNIFDNNKQAIFIDPYHVNHIGNKIVAESIFKIIKKKIN